MSTAEDSVVVMARGAMPALGSKVQVVEVEIDLATISAELVADGSGVLATADIVEVLSLTQGAVVIMAGIEITETVVGSTALEVGLGVTGGDVDQFVTNVDIGSSTSYVLTDYLVTNPTGGAWVVGDGAAGATTDSIDILFGTVTGTVTAGKLRVFAVVVDAADLAG